MLLDDLIEVIETLKGRIADHGPTLRVSETRTRVALIDPLLQVLGWDTTDPSIVTPEYDVSGRRADYALSGQKGRAVTTLEVRKLGEFLSEELEQALACVKSTGMEFAVLTDGDQWDVYDVFDRPQLEGSRILSLRVSKMPVRDCALHFLLLWQPNISSRQPLVPRWVTPPPVVLPGWSSLSDFEPKPQMDVPKSIKFPDGSVRPVRFWRQLVVETADWLWSEGRLTESELPVKSGRRRYIVSMQAVHLSGEGFTAPHPVDGTPLVVETNLNRDAAINNTKTLLEHSGLDLAYVQLEVKSK